MYTKQTSWQVYYAPRDYEGINGIAKLQQAACCAVAEYFHWQQDFIFLLILKKKETDLIDVFTVKGNTVQNTISK